MALFTESELNRLLQSLDEIPSGMDLFELNGDPTWSTDDMFDPSFPLLEEDSLLHPVTDSELGESEPHEPSSSSDEDSSELPESGDRGNPEGHPSLGDDEKTRILHKVLLDRTSPEESHRELLEKLAEMHAVFKKDIESSLAYSAELQKEVAEALSKHT